MKQTSRKNRNPRSNPSRRPPPSPSPSNPKPEAELVYEFTTKGSWAFSQLLFQSNIDGGQFLLGQVRPDAKEDDDDYLLAKPVTIAEVFRWLLALEGAEFEGEGNLAALYLQTANLLETHKA